MIQFVFANDANSAAVTPATTAGRQNVDWSPSFQSFFPTRTTARYRKIAAIAAGTALRRFTACATETRCRNPCPMMENARPMMT